ncbi:PKD domain-containing protein [Fluviicola sp.]|uniref:PKD domain-containing protein n=1 Tax=Fluviicola sp. TaxID=1917219 RepID=UPI002622B014|nr:PKD domain-containing protein [Fluviicola sp.]
MLQSLLFTLLFSSVLNNVWSQTDECASAPGLTVGSSCSTTNWTVPQTFTNSAIAYPACAAGNYRDGWYSFIATSTTTTVRVENFDRQMAMAVYSGCSAANLVACADAVGTQGVETATFTTTVGTTYRVRIIRTNNNGGNDMTGNICVYSTPPAPANDNCATATVITQSGSCTPTSGTVAGATNSGIASCTGTTDDDVWYTFTATATSATITRTTGTGSSWDSGVEIFASTGAAPGSCIGASLGCQDAESDFLVSGLTVGLNYYVRMYTWSSAFTPSNPAFTICVTGPPAGSIYMPSSGSVSACSGTFYDSGGPGDYTNSDTRVFTICPSTAGAKLKLVFSAFQTESVDLLEIFDGNSTAAPSLGTYSGATGPGTVQATSSNSSGCLTFRFTSDFSLVYSGWVAAISCVIPCQTITTNITSVTPAPGPGGIIRLCQGQSLTATGTGNFSSSGAGATYSWNFGNGVTASGNSTTYTYPAVGSYYLNLVATDANGCTNTNYNNQVVQVSTTPSITTSATPSTLCTNQSSALNANVAMTTYSVNCTPPVSGTTFLPDGSGVSYQTSITANCYNPAATVTSVNDISNVCLTMEHSYLGDLQIELICPTGQTMILKSYAQDGLGTYLGAPIDDVTSGPGTGRTYCFTPTATVFLVDGATSSAGSPAGNSVVAGDYKPLSGFSSMIGCPLNGSWTIRVTDNLNADDGYIFNWDVNFSSGIIAVPSYTPTIVSQGWVAQTTLTSTGATTANVVPTNQGVPCFTYSVTDNFGCTYTAPQCITVNCGASLPIGLVSFDASAVENTSVQLNWETSSEQDNDYFVIERSADGFDGWEDILQVDGAGNSETPKEYTATDEFPLDGVSYYRLKQVDFNGQQRIHETESVFIDNSEISELILFPNPATDLLTIKGDLVSLSTFELLNPMGQNVRLNVHSYKQDDGTMVLDVSTLKTGVYLVKNGAKVYSFVKQ